MFSQSRSTQLNHLLNINEYIDREKIIKQTPGGIDATGFSFRIFDGRKISEAEFMQLNPPVKLIKDDFGKGETIGKNSFFF